MTERYLLTISTVVPRPIAWISTRGSDGVLNLAPFSFFSAISASPPLMMVSIGKKPDGSLKDTLKNILDTGEYCINIVSAPLAQKMVDSSAILPYEVDEFQRVGVTPAPCEAISAPRVAECGVSLECILIESKEYGEIPNTVLIGEAVLFHVEDGLYDGRHIDVEKLKPVGRLGKRDYSNVVDHYALSPRED